MPLTLEEFDAERHGQADAAIVAYPHGAAAPVVAALHERGVRVVDLSADFRLRLVDVYEQWYVPHPHPELIGEAVYGLPELRRAQIEGADIVANPGCFPTAALLALAPLAPWLDDVVIDAKTGVSGAGRSPTATTHFVSADENVTPYGVGRSPPRDRDRPGAGLPRRPDPAPPSSRTCCRSTRASSSPATARCASEVDVDALFARAYASEPFVEMTDRPPGVRDVRDTNYCRIHARVDERTEKVFVFAAIDNLWKGASSQAVQNLNLMFDVDETVGLL